MTSGETIEDGETERISPFVKLRFVVAVAQSCRLAVSTSLFIDLLRQPEYHCSNRIADS